MSNLHITFSVTVSDSKYYGGGIRGEAECKIDAPEELIEGIEPGNMIMLCLKSAIAQFRQFHSEATKTGED